MMNTKLLKILLILSLGFNLGIVITFGHHWLMRKEFKKWPEESSRHKKFMHKTLGLTDEQAKLMDNNRESLEKEIFPLKEELKKKRLELASLLDADTVDNSKIETLTADISLLQMKIEKNVINNSINIRKILTIEQQKKFKAFLKKGFQNMSHGHGFMHKREME